MNEADIVLRSAKLLVKALDKVADKTLPTEIADVVKFHAKGAGVAGLAAGWAPGVGSTLAVATAAGFVWTMYGRINSKLGVPIGKNILKTVASALCTNLAAYMATTFVGSTLASLVPGLGSVAAAGINGAMVFALTWVSGIVYLKLLTLLAVKHVSFESLSVEEMKATMKEVVAGENIRSLLKEAKNMFTRQRESGELNDVDASDYVGKEDAESDTFMDGEEKADTENEDAMAKQDSSETSSEFGYPRFCPECGAKASAGKFCRNCGTKL